MSLRLCRKPDKLWTKVLKDLVSKVPRRWKSETGKLGIKQVDKSHITTVDIGYLFTVVI